MPFAEDQHAVEEFSAQGAHEPLADRVHARSLDGGAQDLVPAAWETASNEAVKFGPRSRIRNLVPSSRSSRPRERLRACCTVHSPVGLAVTPPRCIRRVLCSMKYQDVDALQQHGVHVQEVDGEDPGGLGVQELPPGRVRTARRRIDAGGVQNLPDGGRCDSNVEFRQLAMDPAVSPPREMLSSTFSVVGLPAHPRRAARPGHHGRCLHRLGDPPAGRDQPGTRPGFHDLGQLPALAG
jgi:hypothetical protein